MGYDTNFNGFVGIEPSITDAHRAYIVAFSRTRRMKRDAKIAETLPDPIRLAVGLPIGEEGCFFVGGSGYMGQERDASVIEHNEPPNRQPELWCKWTVSWRGSSYVLEWNECEKFTDYIQWMRYLVDTFFAPWGYTLNGTIEWQGEDADDRGRLIVWQRAGQRHLRPQRRDLPK